MPFYTKESASGLFNVGGHIRLLSLQGLSPGIRLGLERAGRRIKRWSWTCVSFTLEIIRAIKIEDL